MPKKNNFNKESCKAHEPVKSNGIIATLKKFFSFLPRKKARFNNTENNHEDLFEDTINEIKSASKFMSEDEKVIFSNFLKFGSKTVARVMIPRSDICSAPINAAEQDLINIILENGHTRTMVYQDTLDNIIGFVHIKDLYNSLASKKEFNLKKLVRKHIVAAPSMKLVDLLAEMQKRKTHIAVILDEYGGTDGIVTIEDVIEELVGEIDDEHDAEDKVIESFKIINPKTVLCNARVHIEEIEKALRVQLKKQDDYFETVGGLVLARAGHFPKAGSIITIEDNVRAEILESNSRTIKSLKIMVM